MSSHALLHPNTGPVTLPGEAAANTWMSPSLVLKRMKAINQLMEDVLQQGLTKDYGKIPGTPEDAPPCLFKSGSEKILAMFQIAVEPFVEDLSTDDCFRYRVITRMTYGPTGQYLGSGVGECSSNESKYKWKRTYSKSEYDSTDPGRRRLKWKSYKGEESSEMQIRQEPADVANTVLKIAKKRSQVDGTLTVTGASSMFTQDLEDMDEGVVQVSEETSQGRGKQRGRPRKPQQPVEDVKCADCGAVSAGGGQHLPHCKYHPDSKKAAAEQAENKAAVDDNRLLCVLKSATKKPTSTGGDVYEMHVTTDAQPDLIVYCFHLEGVATMLPGAIGKPCIFRTKVRQTAKGAYIQVDEILEAAGVAYKNNRPSQALGQMAGQQKAEEPW